MAVILKSTMCGPRGSFQAGQRAEFDTQTEHDLVQGGYAEYLGKPPAPVERAVAAPAVEHAVAPQQPVIPQPSPESRDQLRVPPRKRR